ncbi:MAG: hypothetical protein H0U88_08670 [Chthoniobacterales bacterium]|nr:hypothetical protein [Chthoniobacterales bacterium]
MTQPATAEFSSLFDWSPARGRKLALVSFISGSALLHALCFYVFQIIYPPTVTLPPPPARVNIITPASEEGRLLLQWIEAEDPALSSTTQRPADATLSLPMPEHIPSYLSRRPALREPTPSQPDLHVPSSHPPAPVPRPRNLKTSPARIVPTKLTFGPEAPQLGQANIPPLRFTASIKEPPQSTEFRVAFGARGDVRYCFLERSSGDAALDKQARNFLLLARFLAAEDRELKIVSALFWTTAIFEWGNDIAAPATAASAGSSAP